MKNIIFEHIKEVKTWP